MFGGSKLNPVPRVETRGFLLWNREAAGFIPQGAKGNPPILNQSPNSLLLPRRGLAEYA